MQSAWVIENGDSNLGTPIYATLKPGVVWSYSHEEATRFSRQEDAEAFATRFLPVNFSDGTSKAHRIREHQWG